MLASWVISRALSLFARMANVARGVERPLYVDLKRINFEDCRERRAHLDEDVEYRNRVKRRILEGLDSRAMKPLIDRVEHHREKATISIGPWRRSSE
jgi:hypothetical protein